MPIRRRTTRRRRVGRPRKRTVGGRRTVRRTRGRGFFSNVWGKIKSKVSDLWNNNKGMLQAKAMGLVNQAKDKALDYARTNKILSSNAQRLLPSKFGINNIVSGLIARKTGMGKRRTTRRRTVGRPKRRYGRGFFSSIGDIASSIVHTMTPAFAGFATKKLLGGKRRKPRARRTRRTRGRGILSGLVSQMLPF